MKYLFSKRMISILTCLAILLSGLCLTSFSAFAEGDEGEEFIRETESTWDISVPQIRVFTQNHNGVNLQKEDGYQSADILITDTDGSTLSDAVSFKVRGNTTALSWMKKKPYTFKFAKKKNVLGLGSGKKWALIANAMDPTLLRSLSAFALADELGLAYTSQRKVVEVWVDNSFRGCYMLFEPVQQGKDRVNIDIESNDGKKDFLMEYEAQRQEDDVTYFTADGLRFIASEPEEPDEEQLAYIQGTVQSIINTMKSGDRNAIEAVVDTESFAKYYLLNEYLKTFDFSMSSVFFYYKEGKLYAGPAWDYDLAQGNANPEYSSRAAGTYSSEGLFANDKNLYRYLTGYSWFTDLVKKQYREHYAFISSIGADGGYLDAQRTLYQQEINRNYSQAGWSVSKWWINIQLRPYATYDANFNFLKTWCAERNAWLTSYWELFDHPYTFGDANGDGIVDVNDVTAIQRVLAEYDDEGAEGVTLRADILGKGRLSIMDATAIQRYLAEFDNTYDIGSQQYL